MTTIDRQTLRALTDDELEDVERAVAIIKRERAAVRARDARRQILRLAAGAGIDLASLADSSNSRPAPAFRNPDNPFETWTGRGRKPGWVRAHLSAGKTLADLAIRPDDAAPAR